jgi:hypothetical protein
MRTQLRQTGAAAVEMAITMVVLIPLIFLALFLEDFIYYRLNGQEPLIAAAWDHITPDYMTTAPDVGGMNRLKYCDHTAAYDSYNKEYDCQGAGGAEEPGDGDVSATGSSGGDIGHHHATGAHQCWLGGGQQLRCSINRVGGAQILVGSAMQEFHASPWNKGGTATCSAQLNVFNWIIPKSISEGGGWLWSKKQTTNRTQFGKAGGGSRQGEKSWGEDYSIGDAHKDGSSISASDNQGDGEGEMGSWLLSKEQHAVLVDPWALTHIAAVSPLSRSPLTNTLTPGKVVGVDTPYNPLLSRTGHYYRKYGDSAISGAMQWNEDMSDYLDEASRTDGKGDNLNSVPVMWKPEKTRRGYKAGYASGYEDSRQGNYSEDKFPKAWGPQ